MFKHPNNTSQRSALSLKFNFEVNLFEQSRRVSQARRRLEKERLEGSFVGLFVSYYPAAKIFHWDKRWSIWWQAGEQCVFNFSSGTSVMVGWFYWTALVETQCEPTRGKVLLGQKMNHRLDLKAPSWSSAALQRRVDRSMWRRHLGSWTFRLFFSPIKCPCVTIPKHHVAN